VRQNGDNLVWGTTIASLIDPMSALPEIRRPCAAERTNSFAEAIIRNNAADSKW
jgi:hypothetical protein